MKTLTGTVEAIGDDDSGQPCLVVHTTREQIRDLSANFCGKRVTVALAVDPISNIPAKNASQMSGHKLAQILVATGVIDRCAVEDPEGYDNGATMYRIGEAANELSAVLPRGVAEHIPAEDAAQGWCDELEPTLRSKLLYAYKEGYMKAKHLNPKHVHSEDKSAERQTLSDALKENAKLCNMENVARQALTYIKWECKQKQYRIETLEACVRNDMEDYRHLRELVGRLARKACSLYELAYAVAPNESESWFAECKKAGLLANG